MNDVAIGPMVPPLFNRIERWFFTYNPWCFFSALCVLFGVYLVSEGIDEFRWIRGQMLLSGVLQGYDFLVIIGSALLFRHSSNRRSSVFMAMLGLFLLLDFSFRNETYSNIPTYGTLATGVWLILTVLKGLLLTRIFRIKVGIKVGAIFLVAAFTIAWMPHVLLHMLNHKDEILFATTWMIVFLFYLSLSGVTDRLIDMTSCTREEKALACRVTRATMLIFSSYLLFHQFYWFKIYNVVPHGGHLAPFLALFMRSKTLGVKATAGLFVVFLSNVTSDYGAVSALFVSILSLEEWRRTGSEGTLFLGLLSLYGAAALAGWSGDGAGIAGPIIDVFFTLVVLKVFWSSKILVPGMLACLTLLAMDFHGAGMSTYQSMHESKVSWGIGFLTLGFLSLVSGIIYSMRAGVQQIQGRCSTFEKTDGLRS